MGTVFGYPAEIWARAMLLIGFAVSVGALVILIGRRWDLSPRDYQRIRWVIWGCLIGLPAYLLAQLSQETSLFGDLLGSGQSQEEAAGALFLINGILCLFVVEAVRRPTVVNVWIPLRRATAFGLLLSAPVLFLHKQIEVIDEYIHMPDWAWIVVASGLVYLIARGHEFATELMDRLFDRKFIRAERHLAEVGETIQNSDSLEEIERLLVNEPTSTLRLASAALFREQDGLFCRSLSTGWETDHADALTGNHPLLSGPVRHESPTASIRSTPPTPPPPSFRTTSSGPFSSCRSAMRAAATRSSSTAGTRSEPISTRASDTCSAASPATPRSPMRRSRARRCGGASPPLENQLAKTSGAALTHEPRDPCTASGPASSTPTEPCSTSPPPRRAAPTFRRKSARR